MDVSFEAARLRDLNYALGCLSRFSDSTFIECKAKWEGADVQLQLTSINSSATGYCCIELPSHFFKSIHAPEWEKVECQTNIKSLQSILRPTTNKSLEFCEISLDDEECRLAIRLHNTNGVTKTHKLTYGVGEAKSLNDEPTSINQLGIGAKELQNFLDKLAAKAGGDVTIWCGPKFFMMRSRDDSMDKNHVRHCLATTVKLDTKAFQEWNITCEASISFPLKEFKAAITIADQLDAPLILRFGSDGAVPLYLNCYNEQENVSVEIVLATYTEESLEMTDGERQPMTPAEEALLRKATGQRNGGGSQGTPPAGDAAASRGVSRAASREQDYLEPVRRPRALGGPMESTPALDPARPREAGIMPRSAPPALFRGSQGGSDDMEVDELNSAGADEEEDWAALEEIERSIERGDIVRHGSQVVITSSQQQRAASTPAAGAAVRASEGAASARPHPHQVTSSQPSRKLYTSSNLSGSTNSERGAAQPEHEASQTKKIDEVRRRSEAKQTLQRERTAAARAAGEEESYDSRDERETPPAAAAPPAAPRASVERETITRAFGTASPRQESAAAGVVRSDVDELQSSRGSASRRLDQQLQERAPPASLSERLQQAELEQRHEDDEEDEEELGASDSESEEMDVSASQAAKRASSANKSIVSESVY